MMNESRKPYSFLVTCKLGEDVFVFLDKFPDQKHERQQVAILVVNWLLLFLTISLSAVSIITIRRSSQLGSKVCYFVILLQSIVDLGVGVFSIPLFICYLSPFLKNTNCHFSILGIQIGHLPVVWSIVALSATLSSLLWVLLIKFCTTTGLLH